VRPTRRRSRAQRPDAHRGGRIGPSDILVNAVCPGYVETELTRQNNSPADVERITAAVPLRRLAQPREIARLVTFLAGEENTYITGQLVVIDGGSSVFKP